jgi:acyl carrier protein
MDIIGEVRQAVAKALDVPTDDIAPEMRLADIGLNSLDVMEVIFELEQKFGIDIPIELEDGKRDLPFETIADVATAIKQHLGAKPVS